MEEFILQLFDCNIIQFGNFTLKGGNVSPIYIDFRQVLSNPSLLTTCVDALSKRVVLMEANMVIGVPYGGIVYSTLVANKLHMPHTLIRKEKKEYGGKKLIEGTLPEGKKCVIIEDVITTGQSVVNTIQKIKGSCKNAILEDVVCLLDRRPNGYSKASETLKIHSITTIYEVLECLYIHNKITSEVMNNVLNFLNKQTDFVSKDFFTKNIESKNPICIKSYNYIFKPNESIVGVNLTKIYDPLLILKFLQKNGHYFRYVLIETELWNNFSTKHIEVFRKLADHYQFFIIDNLLCNKETCENKLLQRLQGGLYQRSNWIDMITTQEFNPIMGKTLEIIHTTKNQNHKMYYLPSITNPTSYQHVLSYKHLCGGILVNKRENWMKYSGLFYFSYYNYEIFNKKSLQQKIYIDNCDFVFINPEQKNGEQFNKIKTITKLSIKNKC